MPYMIGSSYQKYISYFPRLPKTSVPHLVVQLCYECASAIVDTYRVVNGANMRANIFFRRTAVRGKRYSCSDTTY